MFSTYPQIVISHSLACDKISIIQEKLYVRNILHSWLNRWSHIYFLFHPHVKQLWYHQNDFTTHFTLILRFTLQPERYPKNSCWQNKFRELPIYLSWYQINNLTALVLGTVRWLSTLRSINEWRRPGHLQTFPERFVLRTGFLLSRTFC